jgi:hypothetical protein
MPAVYRLDVTRDCLQSYVAKVDRPMEVTVNALITIPPPSVFSSAGDLSNFNPRVVQPWDSAIKFLS